MRKYKTTYSPENQLVSYVIITHNRREDIRELLISIQQQAYDPIEIVVLDSNSTDGTDSMFAAEFSESSIRYYRLDWNPGVSEGRNIAMSKATGDILVIVDDDAVVIDCNATQLLVDRFKDDSNIGALAFKIVDYETGGIQKGYRLSRNRELDLNTEFENWGFRGAGHAIRYSVFAEVGPYPDYSPWGHEELDICLKIIDAGYSIWYFPQVQVAHKISQGGRLPPTEFAAVSLENRIKVAFRNLPWRYVFTTAVVWSSVGLLRSRFNFMVLILAYQRLWQKRHVLLKERRPLRPESLRKAAKLGAPLYY